MKHRASARRLSPAVAALLALPMMGCEAITEATSPQLTGQTYLFGFENTLAGWSPEGTNVDPDGSHWSITASQAVAARGGQAVAFRLDSHDEDARIWIQREFVLRANKTYDVTLTFEFASADWGPEGHWELIVAAGTGKLDPGMDAFHTSSTANGAVMDDGFRWRSIELPTRIRTGVDGRATVAIGIEGATLRDATYYLDELGVKFSVE